MNIVGDTILDALEYTHSLLLEEQRASQQAGNAEADRCITGYLAAITGVLEREAPTQDERVGWQAALLEYTQHAAAYQPAHAHSTPI